MNALKAAPVVGHRMDRLLQSEHENERIVLELLSSVETDGERSQRRIASELGIALGLVNAYLKRCIKKGLVKVHDAPARRYAYYLTPQGFAEKSRLTVQYLSYSFSFFRLAKSDCVRVFEQAKASGFNRLVLAGRSDLAEIAILCAVEAGVVIVAVVDPNCEDARFVGVELRKSLDELKAAFDAVIVTDVVASESLVRCGGRGLRRRSRACSGASGIARRPARFRRAGHERNDLGTLVCRSDAGQWRGQGRAEPAAPGFRHLSPALPQAPSPCEEGRLHGKAVVSALHVRRHRHGDAALAVDPVDLRRVASGLQWRCPGCGAGRRGGRH